MASLSLANEKDVGGDDLTKTKTKIHSPLWQQLMVALIVSMLIVAVCAGVFQYHTETQSMQQLLERQNKKNFQLLHAAVVEPIISEDLPVLDKFVEMLSEQDQDLFSVDIYNADNKKVLSWQRSITLPKQPLMSFSENIILQGQKFGALNVSWSVDHFFQLIEQKTLHSLIFLMVMLLTMTVMVMVLLLKLIVAPVKEINRRVSDYLSGNNLMAFEQNLSSQELSQLGVSVAILGKAYRKQVIVENELRKTKQEIEMLSQRNDLILSSAGEGIFVVDSQAKTIYVNPAATEMTGWNSKDLIGKGLNCLLKKEDTLVCSVSRTCQDCTKLEALPEDVGNCHIYSAIMKGEKNHVSHEVFWHKDGHSFPVEYVSTPILENEHLSGAVIVFKDISQRLIAEQQLKDSEAIKQAMLGSSLDAIIMVDHDGLICEFNHTAEIMFGRNKADVLGKAMVDLIIPPEHRQAHLQGFSAYLHSQKSNILRQRIEVSALRSSGEEFPIELVINPINLHGKLFFTAFISDITERQRDKNAIDEARKQAEKANIAKSQFLATMSHEIRTPLNAIIGINDLLQTTELNSEQWGYVQIAEQSGFALREITNNILDFSKIEAGKLELELQQTHIIELIDSVVLIMAPKAVEKNLELVAVVDYPIPETVLLDPVRIRQVLLNLVSNAIKFTENGFVEIHLETERNEFNGNSIVVSVIDSGIGIAENIQNTLFDEFTQADLTTTRKYGGTGLGLAIASRLVNMSGGNIVVDSVEGEGSCFKFKLNAGAETLVQFKQADINCWIFDRGTKGETSAKLLYKQLAPLVKQVQILASWADMVISEQPCLVFMDESQLAYFSREEVAHFLKQKPDNCSMVLLSNNLQKQINKEWLDLFEKRIIKPIAIKFLESFLLHYIGSSQTGLNEATLEKCRKEEVFSGVGSRILLVEDSEVNQLVIKVMLEKEGFFVDVAVNGLLATGRVMHEPYDLILMDLSMPVMGGIEATKIIRKEEGINQNTPIVALTANAFKENKEQCYQAGMSGFLAKPITMTGLYEEITKHLGGKKVEKKSLQIIEEMNSGKGVIIDYSIVEVLKQETSEEVFPHLIEAFLEQGGKRIKAIEYSIETLDFELLENEIHALKSESATFGATLLADLTKKINLLCKQGNEKQAFIEAAKIKLQWEYVSEELEKNF